MLELIVILILLGSLIIVFRGSPYFGLFGVLIQSIGFSLYLFLCGLPFFSLLTVLVYIGGMMIVFLFSTILSAERYPGSRWREFLVFSFCLIIIILPSMSLWYPKGFLLSKVSLRAELGYREVFKNLGTLTCIIAFILLVSLVVVLVIGFEHRQRSLRKL